MRGSTKAFVNRKELAYSDSAGIPSGVIAMWSGQSTNIPDGWALCNGQNGTPNLTDKFIIGAGAGYTAGATGGNKTKTLTTSNLPSHNHTFSGSLSLGSLYLIAASGVEGGYGSVSGEGQASNWEATGYYKQREKLNVVGGSGSVSGSIGSTGSGAAFEIMPPYYALCFIMKL